MCFPAQLKVKSLGLQSVKHVFCGITHLSLSHSLYPAPHPDSHQVTSCPGTETPCCVGTGSRPGAGCCSARGAAEVSAREK